MVEASATAFRGRPLRLGGSGGAGGGWRGGRPLRLGGSGGTGGGWRGGLPRHGGSRGASSSFVKAGSTLLPTWSALEGFSGVGFNLVRTFVEGG